jgi:hypothetical protein
MRTQRIDRPRKVTDRERIWRVLRVIRGTFTVRDVERLSESGYHNARRYIWMLTNEGYIRNVGASDAHRRPGREALYKLIKITGPLAPKLKDGAFYDPNVGHKKRVVVLEKELPKTDILGLEFLQPQEPANSDTDEISMIEQLEEENRQLRQAVAELTQYKLTVQEVLAAMCPMARANAHM